MPMTMPVQVTSGANSDAAQYGTTADMAGQAFPSQAAALQLPHHDNLLLLDVGGRLAGRGMTCTIKSAGFLVSLLDHYKHLS